MDIGTLREIAARHGASVGVTDLSPFPEVQQEAERRIAAGESAGLGFTYSDPARSAAPASSFPWGRSMVVLAVPYLRDGDSDGPRTVARFAEGDRYDVLRAALADVAERLQRRGLRTEIVYDDDRLIDRAVAIRAGVAWPGKSTMAISPLLGPWFLIGTVVTDAEIELTPPMQRTCGTCDACIPACPTGAIVQPGVLDARRCLAAVFQSRGAIPRELRPEAGGRVYGCDDCLVACPPGNKEVGRVRGSTAGDPRPFLTGSDADLETLTAHWYVPGRSMRFVRRNALVALGNTGSFADVPLLAGFAGHPDSLLRQHAVWALGSIGGNDVRAVLEMCAEYETDDQVVGELRAALG